MRYLVGVLAVAFVLAGCLEGADVTPGDELGVASEDWIEVVEVYDGDLLTLQAAGQIAYSHDQLGDNHREFWVVNGTKSIDLDLNTTVTDLQFRAVPPSCYQETLEKHGFVSPPDCVHVVNTQRGHANLTIQDPEEGAWMVYFFMAEHEAEPIPGLGPVAPVRGEEVPYRFTLTKLQPPHEAHQVEDYPGELVVAHLGVIRISPDQLGDVYREFWVHEGTQYMELEFEASEDVFLVVGQSYRQRDRFSEVGYDTENGKVSINFTKDQLIHGGWYFVVFHESTDLPLPNVQEVSYHMTITKHHGHGH